MIDFKFLISLVDRNIILSKKGTHDALQVLESRDFKRSATLLIFKVVISEMNQIGFLLKPKDEQNKYMETINFLFKLIS